MNPVNNRENASDGKVVCPGCGLNMPFSRTATYEGFYNTSPECWEVYTEVLGAEFSNAIIFGQVHQLSFDSYAVQHAGGPHPDKSVGVHLTGLFLVLACGLHPMGVPRYLQALAARVVDWPHYPPPTVRSAVTVFDVALSSSPMDHIANVRIWAAEAWGAWSDFHGEIADLATKHLTIEKV